MSNRRPGALLAALASLMVIAALLTGCDGTTEPEPPSPSPSPSQGVALPLGTTATVAGFEMTPSAVRPRPGPVYDEGKRIKGKGIKVTIEVAKDREADLHAGELTVPVALVVDAEGQAVKMDDFFGMTAAEAQSDEYSSLYAASYQYACIKPPGSSSTAAIWFSIPEGFVPVQLVIDGGAGQQAAWTLR
jgi:hypothetical protein